uniref:F-box domain-containing protein n=1 Tax=Panagrellus redivivus TaxID=6233 RepID=A0A7E4W1Z8_PANRE
MPFYCTHIEMVVVQVLDITSVRYLIRVNRSLRRVQFGLAKNYNAVQNLRLLLVFEPHIILHTVFSLLSFATSLVAFCLGVPWLNQMFSFYPVYCLFFLFDGMLALYQLHRVKILAMLANKIPDNDSSLVNTRNVKVVDCFGKVIPTQVSSEQHFVELQKAWI